MKLFDSHRAPNPRRVRWVMAEKGVEDIEIVEVSLMSGEHRDPAFRSRTGMSHVPVLEMDDGTCISESLAICRYIEAVYPEPNLFGVDAREQAIIEMWTRRCEMYLASPVMMSVRHTHPALATLEANQSPQIADYNRDGAERFMKSLDRHLGEHDFIAADRFTIADIVSVVGLDFGKLIKYRPPETFENLHRWYRVCLDRPGAKVGL